MKKESILHKIICGYNKAEERLLIFSLVFNVLLIFVQVVMRTVFRNSLSWSEELARYLFIWQIWLGTSIAVRENEHIRVTLIYSFVKNKFMQRVIHTLADLIWFAFCAFMTVNGNTLLQSMISRNATSSGLRIPLAFVYVVLPLASLLVCLRMLPILYRDVRGETNEPEESLEQAETVDGGEC